MCSVSAVLGYGMDIPEYRWTAGTWQPFKALIDAAEEFDKAAEQPDCIDPEKEAWLKMIEARLEKLEIAALRDRG